MMIPQAHSPKRRQSYPPAAATTAPTEDTDLVTKQWDIKNSHDFAQWYNFAGSNLLEASYEKYQYVNQCPVYSNSTVTC